MQEIIRKLEQATGPGRELDADLCEMFDLPALDPCSVWKSLSAHGNCRDCGHPKEAHQAGAMTLPNPEEANALVHVQSR